MVDSIEEYFGNKTAIEVFCVLDGLGKRFKEIAEDTRVSPTTVSNRLEEAKELGLVAQLPAEDPQYKKQAYILTERGWQIRSIMLDEFHLPGIYAELRQLEHEFEGAIDAFQEDLKDEVDELQESSTEVGRYTAQDE